MSMTWLIIQGMMMLLIIFAFGDIPVTDAASSRLIRSFDCDVVGSSGKRPMSRFNFGRRCDCRPGYRGDRCQQIQRCIAGVHQLIDCFDPPEKFAGVAYVRCRPGQIELEVCNCSLGHRGNRCETLDNREHSTQMVLQAKPEPKQNVKFMPLLKSTSFSEETGRVESDPFTLLKMCLVSFVALACVLACGMYCMFRSMRRTTKSQTNSLKRELTNSLEEAREMSNITSLPPCYEEIDDILNQGSTQLHQSKSDSMNDQ